MPRKPGSTSSSRRGAPPAKAPSAWQVHLSQHRAQFPHKSLKQCMVDASVSYRGLGGLFTTPKIFAASFASSNGGQDPFIANVTSLKLVGQRTSEQAAVREFILKEIRKLNIEGLKQLTAGDINVASYRTQHSKKQEYAFFSINNANTRYLKEYLSKKDYDTVF